MLIEQGILVLPQSRTPAVDVRISFANRTTGGLAGAVFFSQIFSGPGILQSSPFFRLRLAVYSGFEPATSRSAVRYATNSANHSQNPAQLTTEYPGFWSQSGFHYAKPSGNLGLNINGTLCEGGNVLEKSRSSLTSRPGPTETCHSLFKHSRVQSYMTDREVIKVSVKTFSNGTPRLDRKFCFYPAMCFYFLLNHFQ